MKLKYISETEEHIIRELRAARKRQEYRRQHETILVRVTCDHYFLEKGAWAGKLPVNDVDRGSDSD